ncbi:hypothetical protein PN462_23075 [Spirulina sp. CS-785/01]|uniref:hypothetical protein n=1 Tax=Spirulina sp. CS-785/01 TaxID=3021716 RepID=UPI0023307D70|nr:hypothetical protein [Spirulina sp. CS-785/01]MDB9316012.1 hypothetical protein [Spirulina sp. CS-785/01]
MTIQELIDHLKQYPPNTRVVIAGYQQGYNDIQKIIPVTLQLNQHHHGCNGAHRLAPPNLPYPCTTAAIFLGGYNPNCPYSTETYHAL